MKCFIPFFACTFLAFVSLSAQNVQIDQYQAAISKDPANPAHYLSLGAYYDQIATQAQIAGDKSKSSEYAYYATDYLQLAIAVAPARYETYYQIGMLYYQKAVGQAGNQQKVITFDRYIGALPYLQKAEALRPDQQDVLSALQAAYASFGQIDKADEFARRIQNVRSGGHNAPYHQF